MKLHTLHEQQLNYDPFGEWIKSKVKRRLESGDSRLKHIMRGTEFTLDHVRTAIKKGECLSNPKHGEKALGPTYLEQTIANVLRDLAAARQLPLGRLNDARAYFGLERMTQKSLSKEVRAPGT